MSEVSNTTQPIGLEHINDIQMKKLACIIEKLEQQKRDAISSLIEQLNRKTYHDKPSKYYKGAKYCEDVERFKNERIQDLIAHLTTNKEIEEIKGFEKPKDADKEVFWRGAVPNALISTAIVAAATVGLVAFFVLAPSFAMGLLSTLVIIPVAGLLTASLLRSVHGLFYNDERVKEYKSEAHVHNIKHDIAYSFNLFAKNPQQKTEKSISDSEIAQESSEQSFYPSPSYA